MRCILLMLMGFVDEHLDGWLSTAILDPARLYSGEPMVSAKLQGLHCPQLHQNIHTKRHHSPEPDIQERTSPESTLLSQQIVHGPLQKSL